MSTARDLDPVADTPLTAEIDLPLAAEAAPRARRTVTDVLGGWGIGDPDLTYDVLLLTSELVGNAVRHGGRRVSLQLALTATELTVAVADGSSVLPVQREDDPDESGRGLAIIAAVASRWGVDERPDGKAVWVAVALPPALPRARAAETGPARG